VSEQADEDDRRRVRERLALFEIVVTPEELDLLVPQYRAARTACSRLEGSAAVSEGS
jgi:hypothetical protein